MTLDRDENGGVLTARDLWTISDHQPIPLVLFGIDDIDGATVHAKPVEDAGILHKVSCSDYTHGAVYTPTATALCEECGKKDCSKENFWRHGLVIGIVRQDE